MFDYKSPTWPDDVRRASGGISYAVDCISEDSSVALISQTFIGDGRIAVIRKSSWNREGIREGVKPLYGAVWSGLGHEILYNSKCKLLRRSEILSLCLPDHPVIVDEKLPASPTWRQFSVDFFKFLSTGSVESKKTFPIPPNPVRLMPGGLESIVLEGFFLLGTGKVGNRSLVKQDENEAKNWMKPISGEKLVYNI